MNSSSSWTAFVNLSSTSSTKDTLYGSSCKNNGQSHKTASTIIHSLVTSRLDNGNSLLYRVTEHQLHKLQLLQNAAARVLTKSKKHDHITPILQELHWLPIRQRIQFKILLIAFKSQFGLTPSYIANLLVPYAPSRNPLLS